MAPKPQTINPHKFRKEFIMGSIGYALCKALNIDPRSTMPEKQAIQALFQNKYTGNPIKDRMLSKIYRLGGNLLVDPRVLSTQEVKQELVRSLRVRDMPADQKALTLIMRERPVDPVDQICFAIFGTY
jgi:hypothetical protein